MRRLAIPAIALCSLLAAATSASAQWYQSRHAGDYRQYDSTPSFGAPSYNRRGYAAPSYDWPYGGYYGSPPGYYRNFPSDSVSSGGHAFRAGQYELALRNWQNALVDSPKNGGVPLLVAQALFALGKYEAAARAVQAGMQMLPQNEWGNVVKNYSRLYANIQNYKDQLKALENARNAKPDDPAMRFVLGYHFGYLGYPKHAVAELDRALDLQPIDLGSQELRDIFAAQAGLPARPHPATEQASSADQPP